MDIMDKFTKYLDKGGFKAAATSLGTQPTPGANLPNPRLMPRHGISKSKAQKEPKPKDYIILAAQIVDVVLSVVPQHKEDDPGGGGHEQRGGERDGPVQVRGE